VAPVQCSVWLSSTLGGRHEPLNSAKCFTKRDFLGTANAKRILPRTNPTLLQRLIAPMLDFPTVTSVGALDDQHTVLAGRIDDLSQNGLGHVLDNGPTFSGRAGTGRTLGLQGPRRPPGPLQRLVMRWPRGRHECAHTSTTQQF